MQSLCTSFNRWLYWIMDGARNCHSCGKILRGRSDKRFCDDYCRNSHNNQLKSGDNRCMRNITNALKKNRNILHQLLAEKQATTRETRIRLLQLGFQFKYFTHVYTNKKGSTYFYCFDYGYLALENECLLIVRNPELLSSQTRPGETEDMKSKTPVLQPRF